MTRILLYVFPGTEDVALLIARSLRTRLPGARFAAVIVREDYPTAPVNPMRRPEAAGLIDAVVSQSDLMRRVQEGGYPLDPAEIERIDLEYGCPTIWQLVTADRHLTMTSHGFVYRPGTPFRTDQILSIIQERVCALEELVSTFRPELVLYCDYDTSPGTALILDRIAARLGVPRLVPHRARIGTRTLLNDSVYPRFRHVEKRFDELRRGAVSSQRDTAEAVLRSIRQGGERYHPMVAQRPRRGLRTLARRLPHALAQGRVLLGEVLSPRTSRDPGGRSVLGRLRGSAVRFRRRWQLLRGRYFEDPVPGERYVFYPLHHEPELALLVYAPFQTDQLAVIRNLAQSLPGNTRLYVKEHPAAVARAARPAAYYERLRAIPNVRLVDGDGHALIEGSAGVATITGTAGLEALLLGRPVLTLGCVYYNYLDDMVFHTSDPEEVPRLMRRFPELEPDDGKLVDLITAVLDVSIEGELHLDVWHAARETAGADARFQRYVDFVAREIETRLPRPAEAEATAGDPEESVGS